MAPGVCSSSAFSITSWDSEGSLVRLIPAEICSLSKDSQCFRDADALSLLNEPYDVAVFATRPTAKALTPRIDVQRRTTIIVKGTKPPEVGPRQLQRDIVPDDIDYVVGLFHLLYLFRGQGYSQDARKPNAQAKLVAGAAWKNIAARKTKMAARSSAKLGSPWTPALDSKPNRHGTHLAHLRRRHLSRPDR
jgi:hypothetical protein